MKKSVYIFINICVVLLVFLLTLEILARLDDKIKYSAPIFGKYTPDILRKYDDEGIRCNVPNAQFEKWRINSLGFRGPELDSYTGTEKIRVVCMGASETFGLYEGDDNDWPRQLDKISGDNYEIINAAVVGQFLNKWERYLEKYVLNLNPEIIFLVVNPFSYIDSNLNQSKDTVDKQQQEKNKIKNHGGEKKNISISIKSIIADLRILPKIKIAIKNFLPATILQKYQLRAMRNQVDTLEKVKLNGKQPMEHVPDETVMQFQDDLDSLVKYLKSREILVVLCSYPMLMRYENIEKHQNIFYDFRRFYIQLSFNGIINMLDKCNKSIKHVANENEAGFIDLYNIVNNKNDFGDNVHYTDAGAEKIAISVVKFLKNIDSYNKTKKH